MAPRFEQLNRLFESVRESNHDFRVTTSPFPPIDTDKLARTLELAKKGAERGSEEKPIKTSRDLDDVEKTVVESVEAERDEAFQTLEDQFHTFSTRMRNLDFDGHFARIRQANLSSITDFQADVAGGRDELFGLRKNLKEADEELASFREKHGLKRVARTKSGLATVLKWLVIVALLVVETTVNGVYLAAGNDQGLVGGIGVALGFALVNVGGTVILGLFVIPNVVHRSLFGKFIGLLGIAVWLILALGLNLIMAHYREVSADTVAQVGAAAMQRLQSAPLFFHDIDSWILFATGFLFSTAALVDVLLMRDPYFGYGGTHARYVAARKYYVEHKLELIDNLKEIRDEHNAKVEAIIRNLTQRRRECASIIDSRARLINLYMDHQANLEAAARKLLMVYREANRQTRSTPEPKYFVAPYQLDRRKAVPDTGEDWSDTDLANRIQQAQVELNEQMRQISEEFQSAVTAYHQLDNMFPETINGKAQA